MKLLTKIKATLFLYVKDVIDKKRKNAFLLFILSISSFGYRVISYIRNFLYNVGLFKSYKVKSKVVSIGNIVAGGTGKTSFLIFLANHFKSKNIAIISRGYKSKFENQSLQVTNQSMFSHIDIGDEPMLLKKHVEKATLFIGKNKLTSAQKASNLNFDITFIDDGFQYRKLKKDLEIVMLNENDHFDDNKFLPRGYLREGLKNLKRADYIIINNSKAKNLALESKVRKYTNSPIIYIKPYPKSFKNLLGIELNLDRQSKVALFCGIANPKFFYDTIKEMGFEIVNFLEILDHEKISQKSLDDFITTSYQKNAQYIITTEKDAIKLSTNMGSKLPTLYLEIVTKVIENQSHLETLVEKIDEICL